MPAKAGIQSARYLIFWIPAFAGMTFYRAIHQPICKISLFFYDPFLDKTCTLSSLNSLYFGT